MTVNIASGNPYIDSVAGAWRTDVSVDGRTIFTYGYADTIAQVNGSPTPHFAPLTNEWRAEVDWALGNFSAVSNITFVRVDYVPGAPFNPLTKPRLAIYADPLGMEPAISAATLAAGASCSGPTPQQILRPCQDNGRYTITGMNSGMLWVFGIPMKQAHSSQ